MDQGMAVLIVKANLLTHHHAFCRATSYIYIPGERLEHDSDDPTPGYETRAGIIAAVKMVGRMDCRTLGY